MHFTLLYSRREQVTAAFQAQQFSTMQSAVNQIVTALRRAIEQTGLLGFCDNTLAQPGVGDMFGQYFH